LSMLFPLSFFPLKLPQGVTSFTPQTSFSIASLRSVPFKGGVTETEDSYNFYQSQLRITIERSFGVLVHCWAILRGPLMVPILKVAPLVNCLCCLHNYCINCNIAMQDKNENIGSMIQQDSCHLHALVNYINLTDSNYRGVHVANKLGYIDSNCQPINMVGGGEHFLECSQIRDNEQEGEEDLTPMDLMYEMVLKKGLLRPLVPE
jgi:hypothetical protein